MTVSGVQGKNKEKECTNGLMEITMMDNGKRTLQRALELLVSEKFSMMDSFTTDRNMASVSKAIPRGTQSRLFGKTIKY